MYIESIFANLSHKVLKNLVFLCLLYQYLCQNGLYVNIICLIAVVYDFSNISALSISGLFRMAEKIRTG